MAATRQDAWTEEEDILLADTVLRHIREGGTQLKAFEEVGKQLGRTGAACGFRWNSCIRKQYADAIEAAKLEKKSKSRRKQPARPDPAEGEPMEGNQLNSLSRLLQLKDIVSCLQDWVLAAGEREEGVISRTKLEEESRFLKSALKKAEEENARLKEEFVRLENEHKQLLVLIDRARQLADAGN